ncbi:E3 ubiquitin-protein ligase RSL1-like [Cornus florida]|uniref:E3 ubiquitin-protein ligase RSL1-like n=1 Tax=Cornus florida TaxID=4283 RepID=UPI0028A1D8F5|nr:E3 ubiquitin-protein ligase RSL1-like [Cornus florida]
MGNTVQKNQRNQERHPEEEESKEDDTSTFTCEICIEPMLSSSTKKFKNNKKCVHPFCTDCMMKYIQVKVEEDSVANVPCPALNCEQLLDPLSCRAVVPAKLFDKWCDVLCESAVLELERCYCPNPNCSALVVNECGGNVKKSVCHNCKRPFCFHCKLPWHSGYPCEESGEIRNRNDVEFGILVERRNWMRCPRCLHCIERVIGCRSVTCRCGANFCYVCGSEIKNLRCNCNRKCCACCLMFFFIVLFILITVILIMIFKKLN